METTGKYSLDDIVDVIYSCTYFLEFMLKTAMPHIAKQIKGYLCCSRGKSYITEHCLLWKFLVTKSKIVI